MNAIAAVCLWSAVAITLLCCLGLALMRDFYERLHYMSGLSALAMPLITIAVIIQEGFGQAALKTVIVTVVLALTNSALSHATARAARVQALGRWTCDP